MLLSAQTSLVMRGEVGVRRADLDAFSYDLLRAQLTRTSERFGGEVVEALALREDDPDYLWVPRHFQPEVLWPMVDRWEWSEGRPYDFNCLAQLDPDRGQDTAVPAMTSFLAKNSGGILVAPTGTGKCLGRGTPVLMADGRVKPVEDVVQGDRLVGPSGEARLVLSTTVGSGPLYRVTPIKGEPWVCNDVHVLTLVRSNTGEVVDVPLNEWVKKHRTFKHLHKQFSVGVERFEGDHKPISVDPYFLGVWFGDGTKTLRPIVNQPDTLSGVQVSKPDPEIRASCQETAAAWGLKMRVTNEDRCPTYCIVGDQGAGNPLLCAMRDLVGPDVKIPDRVLRGSRDTRLAFLAGFLDADAELSCNCFILTQKREDWARAAWWLGRSVGLCTTITTRLARDQHGTEGTYHVVTFSGDVAQIPTRIARKQANPRKQKKIATRTGFTVSPIGEGDYYGFTLDGDGRFLLGDFTVTHNTLMGYSVAAQFRRFIGVPVFVGHMFDNWVEHAKTVLGLSEDQIGIVQGDRCDLGKPVTVMMLQSLIARRYPDELYDQIGFLLCDEVHRFGAQVWKTVVSQFPARYRLGLSANPVRKDKLDDFITWSFGAVGHKAKRVRSKPDAAPTVYVLRTDRDFNYEKYCSWTKEGDNWKAGDPHAIKYDKLLAEDPVRNQLLAEEILKAINVGRQIIVLSSLTAHLTTLRRLVYDLLEGGVHPLKRIVADKPYDSGHKFVRLDTLEAGLKPADRERVAEADVIFATYSMAREALNVPKLDTAFFCTPTGDPLQPVGRLREKVEGIDRKPLLIVDCAESPKYSKNKLTKRVGAYRGLGLKVVEVPRRTM